MFHVKIKGNIIKNKKVKGETNTHLNTDMQILNSTVEAKMTETELSTNGTVCLENSECKTREDWKFTQEEVCSKREDKQAKMKWKSMKSDRICRNDFTNYLGKRFLGKATPLIIMNNLVKKWLCRERKEFCWHIHITANIIVKKGRLSGEVSCHVP